MGVAARRSNVWRIQESMDGHSSLPLAEFVEFNRA
jgi:hypothetical protein